MYGQIIGAAIGATASHINAAATGMANYYYDRKLMQKQFEYNEKAADNAASRYKNIWDYTNYENQKKHLEAAGLNAGLLYGQGGAGGASATAPQGQTSQSTANPMPMAQENFADTALKMAEAKKANNEANKIVGADTKLAEAETKLKESMKELNESTGRKQEEEINVLKKTVKYMGEQIEQLDMQNDMYASTWGFTYGMAQYELALKQGEFNKILSEIDLNKAEMKEIASRIWKNGEEVKVLWGQLGLSQQEYNQRERFKKVDVDKFNAEQKNAWKKLCLTLGIESNIAFTNQVVDLVGSLMSGMGMLGVAAMKMPQKPIVIKGFGK